MVTTRIARWKKAGFHVFIAVVLVLGLLPGISLAQENAVVPAVKADESISPADTSDEQIPEVAMIPELETDEVSSSVDSTVEVDEESSFADSPKEILPESPLKEEVKTLVKAGDQATKTLAVTFPVSVNGTNFPDATWRAYVNTELAGGDNELSQTEAENVTYLDISYEGITDLRGIEHFTNIDHLYCENNSLTTLDVSDLNNLEILYCYDNLLTTLDLPGLDSLRYLSCENNSLTSLDVTGFSKLWYLSCYNNSLDMLDLTGLANLQELYCQENSLTALDVTGLSRLQMLYCDGNNLSSLEVAGLRNLRYLECYDNFLTSLDVTGLDSLLYFYCYNNSLTSLDVTGLDNLLHLSCYDNPLGALDVTGHSKLQYLFCQNISLTSLDVTGLDNLQILSCYDNVLTTLDVTGLDNLQNLYCYNNHLIDLVGQYGAYLIADGQTRAIPMVIDPSGGFVSELVYDFEAGNAIGSFGPGVTFGTDNRFYADTLPKPSPFQTTLSNSSHRVSGVLTFELAAYKVTFLDWDASILDQQRVGFGASAHAPVDPSREDYTFIAWDTDFSYITKDLEVTALYEEVPDPAPTPHPETPVPNAPSGSSQNVPQGTSQNAPTGTSTPVQGAMGSDDPATPGSLAETMDSSSAMLVVLGLLLVVSTVFLRTRRRASQKS